MTDKEHEGNEEGKVSEREQTDHPMAGVTAAHEDMSSASHEKDKGVVRN